MLDPKVTIRDRLAEPLTISRFISRAVHTVEHPLAFESQTEILVHAYLRLIA